VNADDDGDGVPDAADQCPDSNLAATVVIGAVDSGVPNTVLATGCSVSDRVAAILATSRNRGQFVAGVSRLSAELVRAGTITRSQAAALIVAAARSRLP
jgi:glycosyltransferase A (GT-A) superfamily protein (DUF2064 family)